MSLSRSATMYCVSLYLCIFRHLRSAYEYILLIFTDEGIQMWVNGAFLFGLRPHFLLAGKLPLWCRNSHEELSPWSPIWGRLPKGNGESMYHSPGLPFTTYGGLHAHGRGQNAEARCEVDSLSTWYFSQGKDFPHVRLLTSSHSQVKIFRQVGISLRFSLLLIYCLHNFEYI